MATTMAGIRTKFTDDLGLPLIGGQVFTYDAGTSTPKDSYSDALFTTPNTNPIVLDDAGSCDLYLKGVYRLRVLDVNGVLMDERDNVSQADGQFDSVLANTIAIGELQTSVANIEDNSVIKTDVSNRATGYGKPTSATVYASLRSDHWRVAIPTGTEMGELIFTTYDTERTINGATIAVGAYFNPDLIAKESITGDKIAKGSELNLPKLTATYAIDTLDTPNMSLTATGDIRRSNDPLNAASRKVGKLSGNVPEYDAQKGLQTAHIQSGVGAPKLAYKKIEGKLGSGSNPSVDLGVDVSKIFSVSVFIKTNAGDWVGQGQGAATTEAYRVKITPSGNKLLLTMGASNISAGNDIKILVAYEV